jgi:hypothetical protein
LITLIVGLIVGLRFGLFSALALGPVAGLIVGLNRGGSAVIKHDAPSDRPDPHTLSR